MLPSNLRQARAVIDLSALEFNAKQVKKYAPNSSIMAVIKANAYGHGLQKVANSLFPLVDAIAVSSVDEAIYLQQQNQLPEKFPIFILEGFNHPAEFKALLELNKNSIVIPVIHHISQLELIEQELNGQLQENLALPVWIKIDTGMHRLGFQSKELEGLAKYLIQLKPIIQVMGIMSHLACADEPEHQFNQVQLEQFKQDKKFLTSSKYLFESALNKELNLISSLANSAAIISNSETHFDWVRPGIMLYGINPFILNKPYTPVELKPVMTFEATIIAIKNVNEGDSIGYGVSHVFTEKKLIAIIAIGYGDGYPRHAKTGTPVFIHGKECHLVGRVSMDMICVEINQAKLSIDNIKVGDKALLWGKGLPVERVAQNADTIAYELLCGISPRVKFVYEQSVKKVNFSASN